MLWPIKKTVKKSRTNLGRPGALTIALLSLILTAPAPTSAQQAATTNKVIPLIVMDDVPLDDAIRNLAKVAGINYILDPRIAGSRPKVSGRWENTTAEQMLGKMLQEKKLKIVENPATSVARIASSNQVVQPVPASQVGNETNKVIPVILVDDVRLDDAIKHIAAQANLKVTLDPRLSVTSSGGRGRAFPTVSFRWENLTARQALAALLDNYDLTMVEDPTTANAQITIKKRAAEKPAPPGRSGKD